MSYIQNNLQAGEEIKYKADIHWYIFAYPVILLLLSAFFSWLSGNFWLLSFKISYLCLPLFYETRTTPSCHPSGCAYRQL